MSSLYTYCRTREFCEFLPTSSLSACCRRPAPALPLYEVASPVLLVTMHSQPGRDLALGLRSLPAREGLRRFGRPPKERGGVPAWSSVTSAHLSSLPSPVPDPSRLSRRLRSAADTVICSDLGSGAGWPGASISLVRFWLALASTRTTSTLSVAVLLLWSPTLGIALGPRSFIRWYRIFP